MKSMKKKLFGILLSFAMMLTMIPALGLSQTGYAVSYAETWGEDQTVKTSRSIDGLVGVTNDVTLRIVDGATLTVNGEIYAPGKSVTVKGQGTLIVNAREGTTAFYGTNIIVKGAEVVLSGGAGEDEQDGYPADVGGVGIRGNAIVDDGSLIVTGGNGGNGVEGGNGGDGGFGIYGGEGSGELTVTGGSATVSGGNGGSGTQPGNKEKAVSGSLTNEEGTSYEESVDGNTWTTVTGTTSSKQYVRAKGPDMLSVKLDVGAGHEDYFDDEDLAKLDNELALSYATISGNVVTLAGIHPSEWESVLRSELYSFINTYLFPTDNGEILKNVGYKSIDDYESYDALDYDIYENEEHDRQISDGMTYYMLWLKPYKTLEIGVDDLKCGMEAKDVKPTLPKGVEQWDYSDSKWTDENGEEVDSFKGGKEYTYTVIAYFSYDGPLWRNYINPEDFTATVKGGEVVSIGFVEGEWVEITFKAKADHDWDEGKVTKQPTTTAEGEKTFTCKVKDCGATKTESIPKLKPEPTPSKADGTLLGKMTAGKKSLKIKWNKVEGADGYDIFFARCNNHGKKITCKMAKNIKGNQTFKWTKSGLRKGTPYKAYVKAYTMKDGKKTYIDKSPTMHAYTGNGNNKYTNAKSVTVKKAKVSLKKGKTYKIKAKVNKVKKNKKLMTNSHVKKLRYLTSDSKVATVSKSGKITAKGQGHCTITVLAHNGVSKNVKVTVK